MPKISVKKSNKLSSDNIFYEENNKTINVGGNIRIYNTGKGSVNPKNRKSRQLVEDDEKGNIINMNINKKIEHTEENNELQKPKITKVYRKVIDNKEGIDKK